MADATIPDSISMSSDATAAPPAIDDLFQRSTMAVQSAVNREGAGSTPAAGATKRRKGISAGVGDFPSSSRSGCCHTCEKRTRKDRPFCSQPCKGAWDRARAAAAFTNGRRQCRGCEIPMRYEQRFNAFCSRSCAAIFNNTGMIRTTERDWKPIFHEFATTGITRKQLAAKHGFSDEAYAKAAAAAGFSKRKLSKIERVLSGSGESYNRGNLKTTSDRAGNSQKRL